MFVLRAGDLDHVFLTDTRGSGDCRMDLPRRAVEDGLYKILNLAAFLLGFPVVKVSEGESFLGKGALNLIILLAVCTPVASVCPLSPAATRKTKQSPPCPNTLSIAAQTQKSTSLMTPNPA